jgi:hypothetical protein
MLDKLQELINNGTITLADENTVYEPRTPVLLGKEYLATVEGFSVDADPASLAKREYLVIVDFSTLNITKEKCHDNLLGALLLSDGVGSYSPISMTKTEDGEMISRYDLVFSVPVENRDFEFIFITGIDGIEKVSFKVDVSSLEDKAKDGTPGGCMFFTDVPVALIISEQSEQIDKAPSE